MNPYDLTKSPKRGMPLKIIVTALAMVMASAIAPAPAAAALPAPNWLPGQPMLAGTQVIAMWLPIPGAVKYIVYLNGEKMMESPANQYMGAAPTKGGEYKFEVTAVDASGAEGARSRPGVIHIVVLKPPPPPIFRGNWEEKTASLRWERVGGAAIYNLYRAEKSGGPYTLSASITDQIYKDTGLELDKDYFYTVSVKDVTGKESGKSAELKLRLEKPAEGKGKSLKAFKLAMVTTKQVGIVDGFSDPVTGQFHSVSKASALRRGPDRNLYLIDQSDRVIILDDDFNVERIVKAVFKTPGKRKFRDIAFGEDDLWFITDRDNVHVVDSSNGNVLRTLKTRKPTQGEAPEIFEAMEQRFRKATPWLGAIGVLRDERIMVFDAEGGIFHLLFSDGEYDSWLIQYPEGQGEEERIKRFSNAKDILPLEDDGTVIVSQLVGRAVLRLNPDDNFRLVWRAGQFGGKVGNFLGQGGLTINPNGNLLVTDPTLGTMQVYNLQTGDYMYSYSGPEGKPFPQDPSRPLVDFTNPNFPAYIKGGSEVVLFPAMKHYFQIRRITGEVPSAATGTGG